MSPGLAFTLANIIIGAYGAHVDKRLLGRRWMEMTACLWLGYGLGIAIHIASKATP